MTNEQQHTYSTTNYVKEIEASAMEALLDTFISNELPDAIDLVMLGPSEAELGQPGYGFARYAARLFSEVGASRVRSIVAANNIDVVRLSSTGTFWLRYPAMSLSEEDERIVLAAEAAMNRLLFVKETFDIKQDITVFTEEDCSRADTVIIDTVSSIAAELVRGAEDNPLLNIGGAEGAKGGEWDVRSRFALATEALRLPYRLAYAFDCNVSEGVFSIDFTAPLPEWMPQSRYDDATHMWVSTADTNKRSAGRYTLALGVLLSAIAFGTSVGIRKVRFRAHPGQWGAEASMLLYIDRLSFISQVLPRVEKSEEAWLRAMLDSVTTEDNHCDQALTINHCEIATDTRPFPTQLQELLYASTVQELDVLSTIESDPWDSIKAASADRHDSPLAAIAVLEDVAARADEALGVLPEGTRALYCEDFSSRAVLSLAFGEPSLRFVRYSDAGFTARSMLCDLYRTMQESDRAFQQAQRCVELAPTSVTGYIDASNALLDQNKYQEAIPYLEKALQFATQHATISFLYYRLAFSLWQTGRLNSGLACYVLSSRYGSVRHEAINREMSALLSEAGYTDEGEQPSVPNFVQAQEILQQDGIIVAPSAKLRSTLAHIGIPLVDAGLLDIAAPLVNSIAAISSYRDELFAIQASLRSFA